MKPNKLAKRVRRLSHKLDQVRLDLASAEQLYQLAVAAVEIKRGVVAVVNVKKK